MLQREQSRLAVQHADVEGRAQFVDLGNQLAPRHQVANAHTGQAEFAHGAHHQHVSMALQPVHGIARRERLVSLVHHDPTGSRFNDGFDGGVAPQIGGGVVRVGEVNDGGLVLAHGGQHGGQVKLKVGSQRHADKRQSLQLRRHFVHHKARHRRHHRRPRHIASQAEHGDQLVRAVAQHDVAALGHARVCGQRGTQHIATLGGVAVQRHLGQTCAQSGAQFGRQGKRVLHGVDFHHACAGLHSVGVHGLHVLAQGAVHAGLQAHADFSVKTNSIFNSPSSTSPV